MSDRFSDLFQILRISEQLEDHFLALYCTSHKFTVKKPANLTSVVNGTDLRVGVIKKHREDRDKDKHNIKNFFLT